MSRYSTLPRRQNLRLSLYNSRRKVPRPGERIKWPIVDIIEWQVQVLVVGLVAGAQSSRELRNGNTMRSDGHSRLFAHARLRLRFANLQSLRRVLGRLFNLPEHARHRIRLLSTPWLTRRWTRDRSNLDTSLLLFFFLVTFDFWVVIYFKYIYRTFYSPNIIG